MASVENPNSAAFGKREIGEPIQVYSSVELEFPDSDVSANRKRGREIQEIPKIDSGGWGGSAVAKSKAKASRRQVLEFEDTYGILEPFSEDNKWIFEREDFDPLKDYVESDDEKGLVYEIKDEPFDRDVFLKYMKQVRQSFGFDVDVNLPLWLAELRYFIPLDLSDDTFSRDCAYKTANFAIDQINADMNSKSYELVEVVKNVSTITCFCLEFLTLNAKKVGEYEADVVTIQAIVKDPISGPMELHQWRFKPVAEEA